MRVAAVRGGDAADQGDGASKGRQIMEMVNRAADRGNCGPKGWQTAREFSHPDSSYDRAGVQGKCLAKQLLNFSVLGIGSKIFHRKRANFFSRFCSAALSLLIGAAGAGASATTF